MKRKSKRVTAFLISASMAFSWAGSPVLAEKESAPAEQENSVIGTLAFAQCDDYINIRSSADSESDVTGKIYNDCAATIVARDGDWYEITSGNAAGYVSAEYLATGEEAQQIADKVAYNVATVHPEVLMVRAHADESSDVLDVAQQSEELEVVQWEGDWMKVALDQDTYGYVNAYYVDYNTYYPVAETLEEERQRLADAQTAQGAVYQAENQMQNASGQAENRSGQQMASQTGQSQEETGEDYIETEPQYAETEPQYAETEPEYVETEPQYAETEAEYAETEAEYVETEAEYVETEPEYVETEAEYVETEPQYEETEAEYVETEPQYEETEAEYVETEPQYEETETEYVEPENTGLGQQIANYAVQFVGNPYVYGGTSLTNGTDCSGFTQSVLANFGIYISRTAADQSYGGTAVDMGSLQPGDLIFYASGGYVGHVALYIGGGQIVHASTEETGIIISNYDYNTPYCARRYW